MKIAVMQPYLFPYMGYFQLIKSVDYFVLFDDVNFKQKSWINRNYILERDEKKLITLQLEGASQNKMINQIRVGSNSKKLLKTIDMNYSKAPQHDNVILVLRQILTQDEKRLSEFIKQSLIKINDYLGIETKIIMSSTIRKNNKLRGQEKIISICNSLGASEYINSPGGRELYSKSIFNDNGISLLFCEPKSTVYHQFNDSFVPELSIIDVMMFNNKRQINQLLQEFSIVSI